MAATISGEHFANLQLLLKVTLGYTQPLTASRCPSPVRRLFLSRFRRRHSVKRHLEAFFSGPRRA